MRIQYRLQYHLQYPTVFDDIGHICCQGTKKFDTSRKWGGLVQGKKPTLQNQSREESKLRDCRVVPRKSQALGPLTISICEMKTLTPLAWNDGQVATFEQLCLHISFIASKSMLRSKIESCINEISSKSMWKIAQLIQSLTHTYIGSGKTTVEGA